MESAYVAHVVEQMNHNVAFLLAHGHISEADAELIQSRLPGAAAAEAESPMSARVPPTPVRRNVPAPPQTRTVQARALWAYAGDGAGDLTLAVDDIVEIVEETNADWWTGRIGSRQGLFPSNYVEKISAPVVQTRSIAAPAPNYTPSEKKAYKPFGAAYHGSDAPPPVTGGGGGGNDVNSVGLQQDPEQEKKKSKYGKYGNTMAHSAAGGVGFGAGAAIGGGLVRAIF
ncbi:SH3-domain-containing protein [Rickenella mellea]|uniref:SH3-domain-containing protein n=1 Tax=Rickenella mellea TaxID=50990 RepID=A0A4Y7PMR4_9AGAM|nr:SH3-domain-containing protein [Rickenella mellea]